MFRSNMIWWVLFSSLAAVAFFFMYVRINEGLSFTNLNNIVGWGLWVTFYIYFLGISVGLFLIYGVLRIFDISQFRKISIIALYSSFISLIVGLFFIFIDIGHLGKFWTVFINRNISSILSWELHLYILYFGILFLLLFLENQSVSEKAFIQNNVEGSIELKKEKIINNITYIGIPLAIAVHGGTGALFAVIKARPFWNSAILPITFLISAILSGIAAIIFLTGCFHRLSMSLNHQKKLSLLFLGVMIVDYMIVMLQLFIHYYSDVTESRAFINLLLLEDYSTSFWVGQIGIGIVLTLLFLTIYLLSKGKSFKFLWISSLTCLIGIWFIRMNFIAPTLSVPLIEGLPENMYRSAETFKYVPSLMEWLYSFFIITSGVVVYIFGLKRIPLIKNATYHEDTVGDESEETAKLI